MEMNINVVVYLMSNVLFVYAVIKMMSVFFETRRTTIPVAASSYLLLYILPGIAFLLFNIPIINMLVSVLTLFIVSLNYKSFMAKRFVATACCYFVALVADLITFLFVASTLPTNILAGVGSDEILGFIIAGLLTYMFALLLSAFKNLKKDTIAPPMFWVSILAIPVSSMFIIILVISSGLPQLPVIITVAVLFGINLLTFYLHDSITAVYEDRLKLKLHVQERTFYMLQCQTMYESVEKIKSFRHDVKVHLGTLSALAANRESDEVLIYINRLIGDIKSSEIYCDTGNITFDSIINYKLRNASESGIKVEMDISIPASIDIETFDVVAILGNLLDNALDAVERVDEKWIKLNIDFSKGTLFIKVDNPYVGEVLFKDGKSGDAESIISSKPGDGHGYGLKNIRKSVEKYDGQMKITYAKNVFSAGILLLGREGAVQ